MPETDPAQLELADKSARASAAETAVAMPALQLGLPRGAGFGEPLVSGDLGGCCHLILLFLLPERHAEMLQQSQTLGVSLGGSRNADIHALEFVDFVVVDLREN